jgi:DNA-directed RNA polymerase specialized sigma24 family protein
MDQAYKLGLAIGEREDVVTEFLGDIALKLIEAPSTPRTVAAYVITAFRHAIISTYRKQGRSDAHQHDATSVVPDTNECVVTTMCSEYTLRLVRGDRNPGVEPDPIVAGLAERLLAGVSEADRELLTWLGERVPATVIAAWRGVTHNAVKVKISRLRARLRAEAGAYLTELSEEARNELERFFRRAGVTVTPPPVVKTVTHEPSAHSCRLSPIGDVTLHAGLPYASPYGPEDA